MATSGVVRGNSSEKGVFGWPSLKSLKDSDDFRKVIYKNNPYDISCDYKRIFETYAREHLVSMSADVLDMESQIQDIQKAINSNTSNCNTVIVKKCCTQDKVNFRQRSGNDVPVIRSSKAVGTSGNGPEISSRELKDFGQWIVCDRLHTGHQRHSLEVTREVNRRPERTICGPASTQDNLGTRLVKANNGLLKSNSWIRVKTSGDKLNDSGSVSDRVVMSYSAPATPVKIKHSSIGFRHHKGTNMYIQEYRSTPIGNTQREKSAAHLTPVTVMPLAPVDSIPITGKTILPAWPQGGSEVTLSACLSCASFCRHQQPRRRSPVDRQFLYKKWEENRRSADEIKRS